MISKVTKEDLKKITEINQSLIELKSRPETPANKRKLILQEQELSQLLKQ